MNTMDYDTAHAFVEGSPKAHWDGYTIVIFEPDRKFGKSGQMKPNGLRYRGRWGTQTRIPLSDDGNWRVPKRVTSR